MAILKARAIPPEVILELFSGKCQPYAKCVDMFPGLKFVGPPQKPIIGVKSYSYRGSQLFTWDEEDLYK